MLEIYVTLTLVIHGREWMGGHACGVGAFADFPKVIASLAVKGLKKGPTDAGKKKEGLNRRSPLKKLKTRMRRGIWRNPFRPCPAIIRRFFGHRTERHSRRNPLIPDNPIAWILLLLAAVIGYLMGQWMKARRKKGDAGQIAAEQMRKELAVAARRNQKGKNKKKLRKAAKKSGGM